MKKSISIFYILGLIFSFSSCDFDSLDPIIEIDIPPHKPRLVVNAIWTDDGRVPEILVGLSRGVLENNTSPDTAKLKTIRGVLLKDGTVFAAFDQSRRYDFERYALTSKTVISFIPGSRYQLKVWANGIDTVSSSVQIMLQKPVGIGGNLIPDGFLTPDGFREDEMRVRIKDPANELNAYLVEGTVYGRQGNDTIKTNGYVYIYRPAEGDITGSDINDFYTDDVGNGSELLMRYAGNFPKDPNEVGFNIDELLFMRFKVISVPREVYYHIRSVTLNENAQDNPFAEPVTVYSNMSNGVGIFGISAVGFVDAEY